MSSRSLTVIRTNASFVLIGTAPLLLAGKADFQRALTFCTNYRRRGIAAMFALGDPLALHQDLQRSGAAMAAYLPSISQASKVTSQLVPFFDAVACEDMAAARTISLHARATVNPCEEDESDFLYVTFLMKCFCLQVSANELQLTLDRYREVLAEEGRPADDPRFAVCESFVLGRGALFDEALGRMVRQRAEHYRQGTERQEILEEEWATEGRLFVEGLALLRLAKQRGFASQVDDPCVPQAVLAPLADSLSFDPDGWQNPTSKVRSGRPAKSPT